MDLGEHLDKILPNYLVEPDKARLKGALSQFHKSGNGRKIDYTDFYKQFGYNYFLQSDLIREIRFATFDEDSKEFKKGYTNAIILSNGCDISPENQRLGNEKQCLFAPIINLDEYISDLLASGYSQENIDSILPNIRAQLVSNLFYLPHTDEGKEFIVLFDQVFWFPTDELNSYIDEIEQNRITSLSQYGHYLFTLKLSYHLCRLPESPDREGDGLNMV